MPASPALTRLSSGHYNTGDWNATTNQGGMGGDGHRQALVPPKPPQTGSYPVLTSDIAAVAAELIADITAGINTATTTASQAAAAVTTAEMARDKAQAWAESTTAPGGTGTKSAKTLAQEAATSVVAAQGQVTAATQQVALAQAEVSKAAGEVTKAAGEVTKAQAEVVKAQAWAEGAGAPGGAGTKSAKSHAQDAAASAAAAAAASGLPAVSVADAGRALVVSSTGGWQLATLFTVNTYEARGTLRSLTGDKAATAIVEGLGLFNWLAGSTEPDDDETCFAATGGRWLLAAPAWDLIQAYGMADHEVTEERLDVVEAALPALAARFLTGTITNTITSVSAQNSVAVTATVPGAAVGDRVIVNPPAALESANTGRLSFYAWVSAPDTVTLRLVNASNNTATIDTPAVAAWPILIIKGA